MMLTGCQQDFYKILIRCYKKYWKEQEQHQNGQNSDFQECLDEEDSNEENEWPSWQEACCVVSAHTAR